jgi:hypothetical protein
MPDYLRREIVAGCQIVYAGRRGARLYLSGPVRVLLVTDKGILSCQTADGRRVYIRRSDLCIVVP